jgi:hypothetical protein
MHMYTLKHILARLRLPIVVQLLIAANDIAYKHKHKSASAAAMYAAISAAEDAAIEYYVQSGRIVLACA